MHQSEHYEVVTSTIRLRFDGRSSRLLNIKGHSEVTRPLAAVTLTCLFIYLFIYLFRPQCSSPEEVGRNVVWS